MRLQGKITRWNDQRGFGFVTQNGDDKVFVHISAFDDNAAHSKAISSVMHADQQHRQRADNVRFVSPASSPPFTPRTGRRVARRAMLLALLSGLLHALLGRRLHRQQQPAHRHPDLQPGFQCSGKRFCSQMTSCDEAMFYLKHCPGVEIDGDHDGIPCEQQLCAR
jgi:cold shock CspA family protein